MKLNNKIAVITGAAQGLGLAISKMFVQNGATVCMLDLNMQKLQSAIDESNLGQKALAFECDVCNLNSIHFARDQIIQRCKQVHVLVNNAGIIQDAMLLKMTEKAFDNVINVNLKGVFLVTQAFVSHMQNISASIINISSVAYRGNFGQSNYSASKAGVVGMTKTWALELSKYNIRVNAIAPGVIETDMTKNIPDDVKLKLISKIPLGKIGHPSDIAHAALFLASSASSYIQGEVISPNGGFLM